MSVVFAHLVQTAVVAFGELHLRRLGCLADCWFRRACWIFKEPTDSLLVVVVLVINVVTVFMTALGVWVGFCVFSCIENLKRTFISSSGDFNAEVSRRKYYCLLFWNSFRIYC